MQIKSILAGAAIALAASLGSVSAGDKGRKIMSIKSFVTAVSVTLLMTAGAAHAAEENFAALEGVRASQMSGQEMSQVAGT